LASSPTNGSHKGRKAREDDPLILAKIKEEHKHTMEY
jgi:hypothetical protein